MTRIISFLIVHTDKVLRMMYVRTEIQFLAPKINTSCLLVYNTFWISVAIAL